jgi:VWFA-related protein
MPSVLLCSPRRFAIAVCGMMTMICALPLVAQDTPASSSAQAPAGSVQEAPGQGYHLAVTTRVVVLDVVVTDKHGKLVHRNDLTKDDFIIYEDKVPQRILSFESPAKHEMPVSATAVVNSAADLKKIGDAPVTILVLDELNSKFEDMSYSRQMMVKYLEEQPPVLKQPTVLLFAENTKVTQGHDYTQNRDELIAIVKKHMPEYPWRMMNSGRNGPGAVERMAQVLATLQQLAQSSSGTPGRKNIIWVGNGFPSADLVGLDQLTSDTIEAAVRRVTAKLLASRITMYTINPIAGSSATIDIESPDDLNQAPLDAGPDPFGAGTVNFTDFAPSTGGMSFQGRNDINNVIAEGIAQGDEYYTVSYSPSDKTADPSKYRDIVIKMKDPDLRATTRKGYYPDTASDLNELADKTVTDKQKQRDLALDLSQALTTAISYNGLAVTAAKGKGGEYTIHVTEEHLSWSDPAPDGAKHSEATVAAAWYDSKDKLLGHVAREETAPQGAPNAGVTFTLPLPSVPSNAVRIRFVVRDALSGHMGTVDLKN